MDDYLLIHPDKNYLKNALNKIENKLKYEYELEINKKKTQIISSKEGVTFLGYHFKVKSKKTHITLTSDVKKRIRDGIKKNK